MNVRHRLAWARYFASGRYDDRCWWCARHALTRRDTTPTGDPQEFRWALMAACRTRATQPRPH